MGRLTGIVEITEENMKDVELVVEAAIEDEKIKCGIFKNLDEKCPANTILASNTSSLPITKIATATKRPEKVIGMHFFNPAPVMKLIEIIKGIATDDATTKAVVECAAEYLAKSLSKHFLPLRCQPCRRSDAERSLLCSHGRRCFQRRYRRCLQTRLQPSDGTARTVRPDR